MRVLETGEQLEAAVQASVMRFYASFGCEVARFSERRRSRIQKGWPDLVVFCPRKQTMWFHECKRESHGVQSEDQRTIQGWAEACGVAYVLGGVQAASDHLVNLGLLKP